jgi:hypothetical protein
VCDGRELCWGEGTERTSPSWGFAGSSDRWWNVMTGVVVRVSVLSEGVLAS